jgi:hypothetical protein
VKIKARVTSLDDVPEQYRDRYTPAEDGKSWTLDELDIEDVTALKANSERLRKSYNAAQEELKKKAELYGDLDPEAARAAMLKLEELKDKEHMDKGEFQEVLKNRTAAMEKDHQTVKAALEKALEEQKTRAATLEKELQRTVISNDLSTRAGQLKIKPEFIPFLQLAANKDWVLDDDGKAVWRVDGQLKYGKDPTKPADMGDYLTEMIASTPSLVEGSHGTGANGNTGRNGAGLTISQADMRDVRKYEAVKAKAKEQGLSMTQVQVTE